MQEDSMAAGDKNKTSITSIKNTQLHGTHLYINQGKSERSGERGNQREEKEAEKREGRRVIE